MGRTSIDQVIQDLEQIVQDAQQEQSTMGYFAALYLLVTKQVKAKIDEGFFDNNLRMERLDVVFASRYLDAYNDYKAGKPVTQSWQVAFEAAGFKNAIIATIITDMIIVIIIIFPVYSIEIGSY